MAQPRPQLYNFAHRILPLDVQREPNLWSIITGDRAYGYLQQRWQDAAAGGASLPSNELQWVAVIDGAHPKARCIRDGEVEICVLRMPPPQAPTEPHFVAFVRDGSPLLRYFVLEQSASAGVYWAEWRAGMRIRGADVPPWSPDQARVAALPLPYLAAFVDAILGETRSGPPGVPQVASQRAPASVPASSPYDKPWMALIPLAIVGIALAINPCSGTSTGGVAAYAGPRLAAPTAGEVERYTARTVIDDARRTLEGCDLPGKLNTVIERAGFLQQKIPLIENPAELKRARVDQIFAKLEPQQRIAKAMGGFSCEIPGLADLKALVAKPSPDPALGDLTRAVRAATAAFTPARLAVGSHSFCDRKDRTCKAALIWVDVTSQKPVATLWASAPWAGGEADNESVKQLMAELLAKVASWP